GGGGEVGRAAAEGIRAGKVDQSRQRGCAGAHGKISRAGDARSSIRGEAVSQTERGASRDRNGAGDICTAARQREPARLEIYRSVISEGHTDGRDARGDRLAEESHIVKAA